MSAPRFLVVDEKDRPMTYLHEEQQFVYCDTIPDAIVKATAYVKEDAEEYIRMSKAQRRAWKFDEGQYFLMPFE